MKSIINQILQWPVIVQGALGSALFWVVLVFGEKLVDYGSKFFSKYFKRLKSHDRSQEYIARKMFLIPSRAPWGMGMCLYMCLHYTIRGIIFITLGFIFRDIIGVFSLIGYLGGLYFFFRAAGWVARIEDDLTALQHWERVAALELEMYGKIKEDTQEFIKREKANEQKAA